MEVSFTYKEDGCPRGALCIDGFVSDMLLLGTIAGLTPDGSFGVTNPSNARGFMNGYREFRFHENNWRGNQHVRTYRTQAAKWAKPLGRVLFVANTGVDYNRMQRGEISSGQFKVNLIGNFIGIGVPLVGIATWGNDAIQPYVPSFLEAVISLGSQPDFAANYGGGF